MEQKKIQCKIPFQTIQEGTHEFTFIIKKSFIEQYEIEEVLDANVTVTVVFQKKTRLHHVNYSIKGTITVPCDRCLDDCVVEIEMQDSLIVTTASDNQDSTDADDIYYIKPNETEINISNHIYESIILALPLQRIHSEGMCNKEIEKHILSNEHTKQNNNNESIWDSLQNIFDN